MPTSYPPYSTQAQNPHTHNKIAIVVKPLDSAAEVARLLVGCRSCGASSPHLVLDGYRAYPDTDSGTDTDTASAASASANLKYRTAVSHIPVTCAGAQASRTSASPSEGDDKVKSHGTGTIFHSLRTAHRERRRLRFRSGCGCQRH